MSNDTLTDTQRKALLKAEVQKLQSAGMDYESAFATAYSGHPEWHTTEPLGGHRQRRTGQIANVKVDATGGPERTAEIQRLVAAYQKSHPNTSYETAFAAVLRDPANKILADSMHQPQRAFKPVQMNHGTGVSTPPRSPAPKSSDRTYGPGVPPNRVKQATS